MGQVGYNQGIFHKIERDILLFNTLITMHSFIAEKLEMIFSPTHEIMYIAGYLLTMDDEYNFSAP